MISSRFIHTSERPSQAEIASQGSTGVGTWASGIHAKLLASPGQASKSNGARRLLGISGGVSTGLSPQSHAGSGEALWRQLLGSIYMVPAEEQCPGHHEDEHKHGQ